MSSEFEKFYPNTKNALFTEENNYTQHFGQSDKVPPSGLLGNISLDNTILNINYETTFLSETAGGTKFLTNIEICWTHAANIGKKQAERFVENSLSNQPDKIMPLYGSNVVTSNSIEANLKNSFTMQIAQADPRNHYSLTEQSNNFSEEFIEPLREKYPDIGLSCEETGTIQIDNPTFGEKIQITSYRPYTLNAIVGKNGQKIFDHNCALMGLQITQDSDYIATIREKHPSSYDIIQKVFVDSTACIENISLIPNKNTLEKLLLLDCYLAAACYSSQPEKKPSKLPAILTMNIADRTYEIKNLATFMEKIQAYFGFSFPKYSEAKMKNVDKQILYYPPNIYFSQKPSAPKSNPSGFFTPSSHTVNYQPLVNKIFSICAESLIVDAHVAAAMNKFSQYYKSLTQNLSNDTACYDLFYKCILKKIEINPLLISVFNREDIILLEPEDNSESVMKNIKFLGEKIDELDYVLNQRSISFS